jgi:hypothetical protein
LFFSCPEKYNPLLIAITILTCKHDRKCVKDLLITKPNCDRV